MPLDDLLTDDQVAELLVKEAQDCSLKYSAMGLDAFKSNKRPANQPKPNTRFLNNIIRDTNSHNRALLAKESAESKAKLRDLEDAEDKKRWEEERRLRRIKPGPSDTRKRMLGDIAAILGGPSKRRKTEKAETSTSHTSDSVALYAGGDRDVRREKSRKELPSERDGSSHRTQRRNEARRGGESSSSSSHRRGHKERSPRRETHYQSRTAMRTQRQPSEDSSDSDPLDDIIGPAPANKTTVHRRGRGANAATSGIDDRFAHDYDPTKDVTPEQEDSDDWDNAVEAFRDRQKWKQQGADRLRSAGFTEEQIKKWEKGDNKDESDVQWTKVGGLREWDRGKVVSKDGTVTLATDTE
ncbi:uncharacterized protein F4812DRAFT_7504 [Daldinia caldariorum]|uniref:uncharacterized protein n=1 Tax=Daldinia caldariorum TaxID=326644 RepID=UPI002007EAB1|nr:uncharacterized protein F4812DRAFT_7504 [Daldinia caldariorum]KAI1472291.1 hypothetical protein F4812DRAFT_7504 [Daldinia caldariorum]